MFNLTSCSSLDPHDFHGSNRQPQDCKESKPTAPARSQYFFSLDQRNLH